MPWQLEIKGNALYLEGPGLATVGKTDLKMSQEVKFGFHTVPKVHFCPNNHWDEEVPFLVLFESKAGFLTWKTIKKDFLGWLTFYKLGWVEFYKYQKFKDFVKNETFKRL